MPILAIDHIQLAMPPTREAEARAFYGTLLGLDEVVKPASLQHRGGCWFERGSVKVHLGVEAEFSPAKKAHPAFLVGDLAALKIALATAGVAMKFDVPIDGFDRMFVDDPFGNRIELLQKL